MKLNQNDIDRAFGDTPDSFSRRMERTLNQCANDRRARAG